MREYILGLPEQFKFRPEVINRGKLKKSEKFMAAGMGGSHLAAGMIKTVNPFIDLLVHRDYGLPRVPDYFLKEGLLVASSYSGNTEETLNVFEKGLEQKLNLAAISSGGKLLEEAEKEGVPFIKIKSGLLARMAVGYSVKAFLKLAFLEEEAEKAEEAAEKVKANSLESAGKNLADFLSGGTAVIYASGVNFPLAYYFKIHLNETAKMPAFCNFFPELNHNEMASFLSGRKNGEKFRFVFLADEIDVEKIRKRMKVTKRFLEEAGIEVKIIELLAEKNGWEKIIHATVLASWTALFLAEREGFSPLDVFKIEKFKEEIR